MVTILVVDDDQAIRDSLWRALTLHGYEVTFATEGDEALDRLHASKAPIDLLIVDVLMPGLDGLELTRRLRADGRELPILILTGLAQVADRIEGLEAGADDYLVKPFALAELIARIRALLRRAQQDEDGPTKLFFADVELDTGTREARRSGDLIWLTRTEFTLLELFLRNPRQVLPRELILERVWGYEFDSSNSLDVYISYLRKKIEAGGRTRLIQTVRGIGYALRDPERTPAG